MKTKLLKLSEIVTTAGTQIRARIDGDTVEEYAEAMTSVANKFPPVIVFHDGSQFILADGFHRVMAASRNQFKDIEADVRKGTKADALKYALGANSSHGLKRTNADKRRSVELALAEWPKLSTAEIARICAVSRPQVDAVRVEHADSAPCESQSTRIGADGKERKLPKKPAQKSPLEAPPQEPPEPPEQPEPSRVVAHDEALGNLKATRVIKSFDAYLQMNYPNADERKWALGLLADHITDLRTA